MSIKLIDDSNPVLVFLRQGFSSGGFRNDDLVAILVPLFEEVHGFHEIGQVAALDDWSFLFINEGKIDFEESYAKFPKLNPKLKNSSSTKSKPAIELVEELELETNLSNPFASTEQSKLIHSALEKKVNPPSYLLHYNSYEQQMGHHDGQTDIFYLGLMLASMAYSLDFTREDDLRQFVNYRDQLFLIDPNIHPSIANLVHKMTELERPERIQDLAEVIERLRFYKEYNPEHSTDLSQRFLSEENKSQSKNQFINSKLRTRLFDLSRRNRMLYFKPNTRFLNLTIASVPTVLHYQNIKADQLLSWNPKIARLIAKGESIAIHQYLDKTGANYAVPTLNRIRLDSNRSKTEYGFSQCRLVCSFLHWYNLKEDAQELISSPLLLLPCELTRTKGVNDQYHIKTKTSIAEVNPILIYQLRELYNIQLPDKIDLSESDQSHFYQLLSSQLAKSGSGVEMSYRVKPKIRVIHQKAIQTITQYRKRSRRSATKNYFHHLPYSYERDDFNPLGIQLFQQYLDPEKKAIETLLEDGGAPKMKNLQEQREQDFYSIEGSSASPNRWEYDVSNLVIGNFNYKKMSLVSDYNEIIDRDISNPIFSELFNNSPRKRWDSTEKGPRIDQQYHVVECDPSQSRAIAKSRRSENYIIQGPPGTGKSQTITNLIADFVAQGKKVLFVCEKRAALDVVFYRLQQQQLHSLCALIHDSQDDKRSFIKELQISYEQQISSRDRLDSYNRKRQLLLVDLHEELKPILRFHELMITKFPDAGTDFRDLLNELLKPTDPTESNQPRQAIQAGFSEWKKHGPAVEELLEKLLHHEACTFLSEHPFRHLRIKESLLSTEPNKLNSQLDEALRLSQQLLEKAPTEIIPSPYNETVNSCHEFIRKCSNAELLLKHRLLDLLDNKSKLSNELERKLKKLNQAKKKLNKAKNENKHWRNKLSLVETEIALDKIKRYSSSFIHYLNPAAYKLKNVLKSSYNFEAHKVKPGYQLVLEQLYKELQLQLNQEALLEEIAQEFPIAAPDELASFMEQLRSSLAPEIKHFLQSAATDQLEQLIQLKETSATLHRIINYDFQFSTQISLSDLGEEIKLLRAKTARLPGFAPYLKQLEYSSTEFQAILKNETLSGAEISSATAKVSTERIYQSQLDIHQLNGEALTFHIQQLSKLHKQLYAINADYLLAKQAKSVKELIAFSEASMAGKPQEDKDRKKSINTGRRILENEFRKSMRYKSIRDLAGGDSGQLIRELKPVWLMSPLSVSDTLPMQHDYFDVVIFDEASQIGLEEGIPPLFRAKQSIIVGDEMQMPPSQFFKTGGADENDLWEDEEEKESETIPLDADSLLVQGSRKLPAITLKWHYRSHYEALIGFSNAAFYDGQLLSIPDRELAKENLNEIIVERSSQAKDFVHNIVDRPISYHYIKNGLYKKRSNIHEAEYIARIVAELLTLHPKYSIGLVAFSMQQQGELEAALDDLASKNNRFNKLLQAAFTRTENDQFVGLFIKNLENVQGDERDIIIMSTCYGYDEDRKMLMNFGPINRTGGEKRLNVLFSRAKKHMVVVSSIKQHDITNVHNEGANFFRQYLAYSEACSKGELALAKQLLLSLQNKKKEKIAKTSIDPLSAQLKEAISNWGFQVDTQVGISAFKCQLAVKRSAEDKEYVLGILVDDSAHYDNADQLEQYYQRPQILRAFGWDIIQVFAKDYYEDKDKVLETIKRALNTSGD
ncbi:AAA domain-containing protein [Chitinophagales bacterium]|nr:AAA domain-containing protein [Chitinophagales bacterium]